MAPQGARGWVRQNIAWLVVIAVFVAMTGCVVMGRLKPDVPPKDAAAESYQAANPPYVPPPPAPVIVVPESVVANPEDSRPAAATPTR